MSTQPDTTPARFLSLAEVRQRVGLAKATIYSRIQTGSFPKPVHLGTSSRWVESEIDTWIRERIEERDQAA